MNIKHPLLKLLAAYVALALVTLTPMASLQRAAMAVGLKTVVVGGLVGGAALLALGALSGPAAAIGAAGTAGTGFLGTMGAVLGTAVAGITGLLTATGTIALGTMATLGLMIGGAGVAIASLIGSPWVIVPALVLGAGLLAYTFRRNSYHVGQPHDQRFDRPFHGPFWDSGSRLANRSESGVPGSEPGFFDRFRSVVDRDRRDDSFFLTNRFVDPHGYVRQGTDFFARLDQFIHGRNTGYAGDPRMNMTGYGTFGTLSPHAQYSADRTGRVAFGTTYPVYRTGLTPTAPEPTPTEDGEASRVRTELLEAENLRRAAYERLIDAVRTPNDQASSTTTSNLQSDEVQRAIQDYREADRLVKELTGRLQAQEKQ